MVSGVTTACPGCEASFEDIDGPVHAYVPSSPGCWKTFGEVQADEIQRFGYPQAHGLVVDAYMAQHPGDGADRRDRQSVFVHLVGLCAALEEHTPAGHTRDLFRRVLEQRDDFPVLRRDQGAGDLTVLHMVGTRDLADYDHRSTQWARAVWASWNVQHERVRDAFRAATA